MRARPSVFSVEDKYRLVLAVISGEMSVAEAARRGKASEQSNEELEVIRFEAGMPTARFRAVDRRAGALLAALAAARTRREAGEGPVARTPAADRIRATAIVYADRYRQWGSRTIATLMRVDGHHAPASTVYRSLKRQSECLR